jgi:pimeloyl-ACP methyl ester carboxylesterase
VVLLIAGLGQQRVAWPPEALTALHEAGYRTVCVDNRDVGRGHGPRGARPSTCHVATTGGRSGRTRSNGWPPITSRCSTTSTIDRAHVLGVSMGGMIAQHVALAAPGGPRRSISVMSTTGARRVGGPTERAKPALTSIPPHGDLDAYVAYQVELQAIIGTPGEETRSGPPLVPGSRSSAVCTSGARRASCWRSAADGDRTARLAGVRPDARAARRGRSAHRHLRAATRPRTPSRAPRS